MPAAGTPPVRPSHADLLAVYLQDHYTGATGGVELFRRGAAARRGTAAGAELDRLAREVAEDRDTYRSILRALGVPVARYKLVLAWVGEKLSRLKANGRIVRRSPLSDLVELEGMSLAVFGKEAGWRTLRVVSESDDRLDQAMVDRLLERAARQLESLEELRQEQARTLFGPSGD